MIDCIKNVANYVQLLTPVVREFFDKHDNFHEKFLEQDNHLAQKSD